MIQLKNITIAYENTIAVKDLSLTIEEGSIIGIVGPNGAGKSTLIKSMVGLISEFNGEIYYNDLLLKKNRYEIKKMLGYAPEDVDLLPYLTGREYLQMVADIRNVSDSKLQIDKMLDILNLNAKQDELINEYSHGMKQKLSVAAAMIGLPQILIFDEAFNGFDPVSLYNLKSEIDKHVNSGGTVIISSHILELIEKWCSQIVVINEGMILGNYRKDEIEKLQKKSGKDFNEIFIELIKSKEY
jgi:ABC-2 type transport system ATP-binding protein